jgi:hypothetical protein
MWINVHRHSPGISFQTPVLLLKLSSLVIVHSLFVQVIFLEIIHLLSFMSGNCMTLYGKELETLSE